MKVVSVATHSTRYFPLFIQSLERNNIDYKILGFGQKWKGFSWRFSLVYDYINSLSDNDIVMFTDAFDCMLLSDMNEIESKFKKSNKEFIISAESEQYSLWAYFFNKVFDKCNNNLLNAGLYIGYVYKLKEILQELLNTYKKDDNDDDQQLFTSYCKNNNIYIDTKHEIFFNYNSTSNNISYEIKNKRIYIPKYDTYPCVYGFPGSYPCISNNDNIIAQIGYKPIKQTWAELFDDIIGIIKRIIMFLPYFIAEFLILIIVIFGIYKLYNVVASYINVLHK